MNFEHLKKTGYRKALLDEIQIKKQNMDAFLETYKYYEAVNVSKELTELLEELHKLYTTTT